MRSLCLVLLAVSLCASTSAAQATLVRWHGPYWLDRAHAPIQFRSISDMDGDGRRDFLFRNDFRCWTESSRDIRRVLRTYTPVPDARVVIRNVAPIPDMDGDGVEEVALTLFRGPHLQSGVRVLSGVTGAPLLTFTAPLGEASNPTRAESAGDVDGDGVTDLLVDFSQGAMAPHFIRVHSGASGAPLRSYPGRQWFQVQVIGDLNGDGHSDLVVGGTGVARVHSGADDAILRDLTLPAPDPGFGYFVRLGCDHDQDGFAEPVVLSGEPLAGTLSWRVFSSATGQLLHTISPLTSSGWPVGWMAHAVCCGDVDRDGVADYAARTNSQGSWPIYSTATSQIVGQLGAVALGVDDLGDMNGDGFGDLGSTDIYLPHGFMLQSAILLGQPAPIASCTPPPPPSGVYEFAHNLAGSTSLSVGDRLVSTAECVPQGSRVLFVVGTAAVSNPIGLTDLCVGGRRVLLETERIAIGGSQCDESIRHDWSRERISALGVAPGDTLHTQFVLLYPAAAPSARVRTSSAVSITFAP